VREIIALHSIILTVIKWQIFSKNALNLLLSSFLRKVRTATEGQLRTTPSLPRLDGVLELLACMGISASGDHDS
jgi:hypothetical protein